MKADCGKSDLPVSVPLACRVPWVASCAQHGWHMSSAGPAFQLFCFLGFCSRCPLARGLLCLIPITLFTVPSSCLLSSPEAVHCYSRFFSSQAVILHLKNLLFLVVLPSTAKSSTPTPHLSHPHFIDLTREIPPLPV